LSSNPRDYDGRSALHLAAAGGHLAILQVLLQQRGTPLEVNALDRFERTPLQDAVRCGHDSCAALLQSKGGCSVHGKCGFALCAAAAIGDLARLQEMQLTHPGLDLGTADYDGRTAMHLAAAEGRLGVVAWLARQPTAIAAIDAVDVMGHTPLDAAMMGLEASHRSTAAAEAKAQELWVGAAIVASLKNDCGARTSEQVKTQRATEQRMAGGGGKRFHLAHCNTL
jgi:hypothetical protein